ncbi:hypothetical protein ABT278_40910 [Streptomyces sp. NPDC001228]|uniref:hypothetical protein n=1 Tax=Streptomyces sp. NPDC001228 TaxID=3154381 RepID=UPI00331DCE3E
MTSASTEVDSAPVFVDGTGLRGRRLRGLGWVLGLVCTGFVVAMVSGLAGTQSQAPALTVPGTADTTPPGRYLNAPLPAAPGTARSAPDTTAVTTPDATASGAVTATAGTADQSSATATAQ